MTARKLIPNVDRRLSAYIAIQGRLARPLVHKQHQTITISRQFGCEAYPLTERLKAVLDQRTGESWTIFDKALIERVSRETALSQRLLSNLGDETHALDKFATLIPGWRTHSEAYEELARHILAIARGGNAIIVGRGGAVVAQDLPNCFHFRLEAPFEYRVQSVEHRLGLSREEAERTVIEYQTQRERFLESFLHCSIADTRYYHAVFNTQKSSLDQIARSLLESWPPRPAA